MPEPLTLADARAFLRVEHEDDDALIGELITAARTHLESLTHLTLDEAQTPPPLRHALRLLVAHWYEHRAITADPTDSQTLPVSVAALIGPYREMRL
jgi:uncharacterized phage protein (predicted DNA packaging)